MKNPERSRMGCRAGIRFSAGRWMAWASLLSAFSLSWGHYAACAATPREVLRSELRSAITDPCLGDQWELVVNAQNPEAPGRLIRTNIHQTQRLQTVQPAAPHRMVIRPGDRVLVHQTSPVMDAQFQAVALESARAGDVFRVQLRAVRNLESTAASILTGPVLQVRATGPGLAQLQAAQRADQ